MTLPAGAIAGAAGGGLRAPAVEEGVRPSRPPPYTENYAPDFTALSMNAGVSGVATRQGRQRSK